MCGNNVGIAGAPVLLHARNFQAPVAAGPDQLLFLGGEGFRSGDQVVYKLLNEGDAIPGRLRNVPAQSTRDLGKARIVRTADPPHSITILLPPVLAADEVYGLWVVNAADEWSSPITVNDPRPVWFSPSYLYSTVDIAGLGRRLRIVGRNLQPAGVPRRPLRVRLAGPQTYMLETDSHNDTGSDEYVAESTLPPKMLPGRYTVAVSRAGRQWAEVTDSDLTILADPVLPQRYAIDSPRFGACRPDDGRDDSACLSAAITAAGQAGGGVVLIPPGTWDLYPPDPRGESQFVLTRHVWMQGAGPAHSSVVRHTDTRDVLRSSLLLLEGDNQVTGLKFVDERHFDTFEGSRAVIQLGHHADAQTDTGEAIRDIVISNNVFRHVGAAVADAGVPIERLFMTSNDFGGFSRGIYLVGDNNSRARLFRIEDAVIRRNRFVPGSYLDLSVRQGVIASELGAARRVDFSLNRVDGASSEDLQDVHDQPGFRAGFFWDLHDSGEMLLLERNRIACSGDKDGDGEAISLDDNGGTYGYDRAVSVGAAGPRSVTLQGPLLPPPSQWTGGADSYFVGHWIVVTGGPGMGQARKIRRYHAEPGGQSTLFEIWPDWDIVPQPGTTRAIVNRQYWQTYIVGNEVTHSQPTCRKSNLNWAKGGEINIYSSSSDSVIADNRQFDTNGIGFELKHSVNAASCPKCGTVFAAQTALEIRRNLVSGEYDWNSDCSISGIHAYYGASPTPEAPPLVMSYGIMVSDNVVEHSDGLRGGGISLVPTWYTGPEPRKAALIDNVILSRNTIRDIQGPPPLRTPCRYGQTDRSAIRIEGGAVVTGTVLHGNICERSSIRLFDAGLRTARLCQGADERSCECSDAAR
jgi:hypothetical protein